MVTCAQRVLITGSRGFIGTNLRVRLAEMPDVSVMTFGIGDDVARLPSLLSAADVVIHLAGVNRPDDVRAFEEVNVGLTVALCNAVANEINASKRMLPLLLASSTQAVQDNPYGRSKLAAEQAVIQLAEATNNPAVIFRLPGVFGKWCKPNYNSVVATFCSNVAAGLPIQIHDATKKLTLVHVDDVVTAFLAALKSPLPGARRGHVDPVYSVTLGELAAAIHSFGTCRTTLLSQPVGVGFLRALYATYVSYMPNDRFAYDVPCYRDPRGVFVEMLKTRDSGQFSYFTAHPGVTRGGHYHHAKTEKFLVIKGEALFRLRHLLTGEIVEVRTQGNRPVVVDTIPGWVHDITNIGQDEMVVMLWANENFDRDRPDTVSSEV